MGMRGRDDLEDDSDISINEILVKLTKSDDDLPLKTHIVKPKQTSVLKVLAGYLKKDYKELSALLFEFYGTYLELMVSYDREGRKEIIRAISSLLDKETLRMSIGEKLTTNLK